MTQRMRQNLEWIIGSPPNTKGLSDTVAAQVLLTTGILTGWLGSRSEIKDADDYAREFDY